MGQPEGEATQDLMAAAHVAGTYPVAAGLPYPGRARLTTPVGLLDGVVDHDQPWAEGVRDAPSQVVGTTCCACGAQRILGDECRSQSQSIQLYLPQ